MSDNIETPAIEETEFTEFTERECKVLDLAELMTESASQDDLIQNYYDFQLYYYNSLTDDELDAELQWVSDILNEDSTEESTEDSTEESTPTIN